jgi:hypothetical protein
MSIYDTVVIKGISEIRLLTSCEMSRSAKRKRTSAHGRTYRLGTVKGFYSPSTPTSAAAITLAVDKIFTPRELKPAFVRRGVLADTLLHEIGHHIHHTTGREHADREVVAEKWRRKLDKQVFFTRYFYILPILFLVAPFYFLIRRGLTFVKGIIKKRHATQAVSA